MAPVIGAPIDGGNGLVYLAKGDVLNAGLSLGGIFVEGVPAGRFLSRVARGAGGDLLDYRRLIGRPPGEGTVARLDIGDQTFYGHNAHGIEVDMFMTPAAKGHAEAHVSQQARNANVSNQVAVLFTDRALCAYCSGGAIGSMMRSAGVEELFVHTPDGWFLISAIRPSVPTPWP
jgi:hypothetical protein